MSRFPDLSQSKSNRYDLNVPLWYRLDAISQSNLKYAHWKNHRKRLVPPGIKADIMPFDADKEMRIIGAEDHMRPA